MSYLQIDREYRDGFEGESWWFGVSSDWNNEVTVRLMRFTHWEKPTKRHKPRVVGKWEAHDERSYNSSLKRSEVPLPEDVRDECLASVKIKFEPFR